MATSRAPKLTKSRLRDAFIADITAAWNGFRQKHPDYTPYAVVLYGVEDPIRLCPHVLSEQGLAQVAQRYVDKGHYDTLDEARAKLRYSVPDSPLFDEFDVGAEAGDALVEAHEEALRESGTYDLLAQAGIDAFRKLDEQGLFGTGTEREQIVLVIIPESVEAEWSVKSARRLNPKPVFERFKDQTKTGPFASCDAMAVSPDGSSIYSGGARANPASKPGKVDEFIFEIVAYDFRGSRLARRWAFSSGQLHDSFRAVACAPDGGSVLALRARFENWGSDLGPTLLLARFGRDNNEPLGQFTIGSGQPAGFAMSPDGTRVGVTVYESKALHVLDTNPFRLLHTRTFDSQPKGMLFLRSGGLLVATDDALLRVDPESDVAPMSLPLRCSHLAADEAQQLLAVSRWFPQSKPERDNPKEFGIHLLRLPSMEIVRTFLVPGHQAVQARLSRDGRLIAFRASEIGAYRYFVVVFDTATGREIARRKANPTGDLVFLGDNRTLAIAAAGNTVPEGIDLWTVPGV